MSTLVDSSVVLDLLTDDARWASWSEAQLAAAERRGRLVINDTVWAECSLAYGRIEAFAAVIEGLRLLHAGMPKEALFLASKAFAEYKKNSDDSNSTLPDFYIGAHAAVAGMDLLTRDPRRVRRYFPRVRIIAPENNP